MNFFKKIINKFFKLNKNNLIKSNKNDLNEGFKESNIKVVSKDLKILNNSNCCPNCKENIKGKKSASKNGVYYICCSNCSYVIKFKDGLIVDKPNTLEEIEVASGLFQKEGYSVNEYSISKNGKRKSLKDMKKQTQYEEAYEFDEEEYDESYEFEYRFNDEEEPEYKGNKEGKVIYLNDYRY